MIKKILLLCLLALLHAACVTTSDGDAMRKDIDTLKRALSSDLQKAKDERIQLQQVLEKATALLTRNSADVGAQVERLQQRVYQISGALEELSKKHTDLAQRFSDYQAKLDVKLEGLANESSKNPPVPEDKEDLYRNAAAKLAAGDHQEARRLLRHFITRFATDPRMDRAQLMLGDSYYAEQKFAPAIVEYKKIIEQYQQSAVVPDALAKIGLSFYQLKFCSDAQLFLSQLLKRYRGHPQTATANKVLKLIGRYKRNRAFCRP